MTLHEFFIFGLGFSTALAVLGVLLFVVVRDCSVVGTKEEAVILMTLALFWLFLIGAVVTS